MSVTAVAALVPRRRSRVRGTLTRVTSRRRPWPHTDAELTDATGTVVLRFMGRQRIPGIDVGRHLMAEGTPFPQRGAIVMLNPLYEFGSGE